MWAIAIKAQSTITIVAQNLEPFREVLPDEPAIENRTAFTDGPSMLGASALHMINRKKLYPTEIHDNKHISPIMVNNSLPQAALALAAPRARLQSNFWFLPSFFGVCLLFLCIIRLGFPFVIIKFCVTLSMMFHRARADNRQWFSTVVTEFFQGFSPFHHAQIHPQPIMHLNRRAFGHIDGGIQIEPAIARHEIDLAFEPVEARGLVLAIDHVNQLTTMQGPQADVIGTLPAQDRLIIGNRAVRPKHRTARLVALENLDGLGDRPHRHLGRQPEAGSKFVVTAFMDARLAVDLGLETHLGHIGHSAIKRGHGLAQEGGLCGCREELEL